jgi:hypothetical protein
MYSSCYTAQRIQHCRIYGAGTDSESQKSFGNTTETVNIFSHTAEEVIL